MSLIRRLALCEPFQTWTEHKFHKIYEKCLKPPKNEACVIAVYTAYRDTYMIR